MPLSALLHPQHLLLNSPKTCVLLCSFISVPFLRLCFLHQCFPFLYQCSSPHTHTHTHTHTPCGTDLIKAKSYCVPHTSQHSSPTSSLPFPYYLSLTHTHT